jgi:hypothetical protein
MISPAMAPSIVDFLLLSDDGGLAVGDSIDSDEGLA